jgi:glutathione-regulated potassium-efflux system ancillary protein KefG
VSKNVLVVLSHPYIQYSFTHQHLADKLSKISCVTVRHIDQLSRTGDHYDSKTEQAIWDAADTIVLEFPMYWYHGPASLKQYLDDVLTTDWAFEGAHKLAGKNLQVLTTTGGLESEYKPGGDHGFSITEVLTPFKATANITKMNYLPEIVIYAAKLQAEDELEIQLVDVVSKIEALTK